MDLTDEELNELEQLARRNVAADRRLLQTDHDEIVAELRREIERERGRTVLEPTRAPMDGGHPIMDGAESERDRYGATASDAVSAAAWGGHGSLEDQGLDQTTRANNATLSGHPPMSPPGTASSSASNSVEVDRHAMHMQMLLRRQQMQRIHQLYESVIARQALRNEAAASSARAEAAAAKSSSPNPPLPPPIAVPSDTTIIPENPVKSSPPTQQSTSSTSDPFQQLMQRQMSYSLTANPYSGLLSLDGNNSNQQRRDSPPAAQSSSTPSMQQQQPVLSHQQQQQLTSPILGWAEAVLLHFGPPTSEPLTEQTHLHTSSNNPTNWSTGSASKVG
ncbi:hypothetical protein HDU78_011560 [Chytriomyces hyalinus]|nr:hypothetical protein HDU78_011560 [Chytriomyces hyalinus]